MSVDAIAEHEAAILKAIDCGESFMEAGLGALAALVSLARAGAERQERGDDCDAVVSDVEAARSRLRRIASTPPGTDAGECWMLPRDASVLLSALDAAVARAERAEEALRELVDSMAVVFSDPRIEYVEVQVDGEALERARLAAASVPPREGQGEAEDGGDRSAVSRSGGGET